MDSTQDTKPHFLALPQEVRDKIYDFAATTIECKVKEAIYPCIDPCPPTFCSQVSKELREWRPQALDDDLSSRIAHAIFNPSTIDKDPNSFRFSMRTPLTMTAALSLGTMLTTPSTFSNVQCSAKILVPLSRISDPVAVAADMFPTVVGPGLRL